jgi:hypothetical protein
MLPKTDNELEFRLNAQRRAIERMEFQHIGMLSVITMDNDSGQTTTDAGVRHLGRVIDLMDKRVPIALSRDHQDLLLPAGLPQKLPDVRDPERDRSSIQDPIPHIPQKYSDRASGETFSGGISWMVFRPVKKIIINADSRRIGWGNSTWPRILCEPDYAGRHTTLLFNPETGRAHFLYGRFIFETRLSAPEADPVGNLVMTHA